MLFEMIAQGQTEIGVQELMRFLRQDGFIPRECDIRAIMRRLKATGGKIDFDTFFKFSSP